MFHSFNHVPCSKSKFLVETLELLLSDEPAIIATDQSSRSQLRAIISRLDKTLRFSRWESFLSCTVEKTTSPQVTEDLPACLRKSTTCPPPNIAHPINSVW